MKKCVLVNCFSSSNEMRIEPVRKWFDAHGYNTIYISSDYHHMKKEYVKLDKKITSIHVRRYRKNISLARMLSHIEFSKKVYKQLIVEKPDIIYMKFPPNSLVRIGAKYKRKFGCKLIFDVFDLWPEALPINEKIKKIACIPLCIWAGLRNRYLHCADLAFTECEMYRKQLKKKLPKNTHTLYLMKKDIDYRPVKHINERTIKLCFLGGINNIINIDLIEQIITEFGLSGYNVFLDIIGDGNKRGELISRAETVGARVNFHGIVYDELKKYKIMSQCDLGLNLIKTTTLIGLTIKSIEYFRAGLGVINNVPFDTMELIKKFNAGLNVCEPFQIGNLTVTDIDRMKCGSRKLFCEFFSADAFNEKLSCEMNEIINI